MELTDRPSQININENKNGTNTDEDNRTSHSVGASWDPMVLIERGQEKCDNFLTEHKAIIKYQLLLTILVAYHTWLVFAVIHNFNKAHFLLTITVIAWLYIMYHRIVLRLIKHLLKGKQTHKIWVAKFWDMAANRSIKRICYAIAICLPIAFILWDARKDFWRLSGIFGLIFALIIMCFLSHKPTKVYWRPVIWGFLLQFIFGIIVLRWERGSQQFEHLANMAITFLDFTKNGTDFVYGFLSAPPNICGMTPVFAFQMIQVIIYVGAIVSVLYFYGIVQAVLQRMARLMQLTLGTTATESLNACACVLLGNAESPLLIRPYIENMTASELHAIMSTGFACISGAVFAAYISFGACPRYLLSAAVMSAPGSLACSKLLYPETERSGVKEVKDLELPPSKETNAMESISSGSMSSVHLVVAVCANLITFISIMALLDAIVGYAGTLVGFTDWSMEALFGFLFYPIAWLIGVTDSPEQTLLVARLIGVKIVVNDFVAYQRLGTMLNHHLLSPRSAMIATYALCSFSNLIACGIQMAVLRELAPRRRALIARLVLRALLAGSISCFMSAAIAGILIEKPVLCSPRIGPSSAAGKCFDLNAHQKFMDDFLNNSLLH